MEVRLMEFVKGAVYPDHAIESAAIPPKLICEFFEFNEQESNKPGFTATGEHVGCLSRSTCLANIYITFKTDEK